jgi:hypothetical protein
VAGSDPARWLGPSSSLRSDPRPFVLASLGPISLVPSLREFPRLTLTRHALARFTRSFVLASLGPSLAVLASTPSEGTGTPSLAVLIAFSPGSFGPNNSRGPVPKDRGGRGAGLALGHTPAGGRPDSLKTDRTTCIRSASCRKLPTTAYLRPLPHGVCRGRLGP